MRRSVFAVLMALAVYVSWTNPVVLAGEAASVVRAVDEGAFADALGDSDVEVVVVPTPLRVTRAYDFGKKALALGPRALDFSGGGSLAGTGSIGRMHDKATYAVFVNAKIGFWNYYSGSVTYKGLKYAPLPGQGTRPRVQGSWNGNERHVTYWQQWHDGRHNDAIEAAQNSLPRKGGTGADWRGTVILPEGSYELTRPIYITTYAKVVGANGKGTLGAGGIGGTVLSAAKAFGPEKVYPNGEKSPVPGGGRLYHLDENHLVVFVPQNRNNRRRVNVAQGGGDGKSVFHAGPQGFHLEANGITNGVLVHASSQSEIQNIRVDNAVHHAFWWRGSDAHVARNITASTSPIGLHFTGSNIDVTLDNVIFNGVGTGLNYTANNNRSASIELRNVNAEGTGLLFNINNPDAISIWKCTHTVTDPGHRVGVVNVSSHGTWPPFGFKIFGSVLNAGYIQVVDDDRVDQWRILTRQVDDEWKPQNDWKARGFGGKRGTIDFDLEREFGRGRERTALNYPGEAAYRIPRLGN